MSEKSLIGDENRGSGNILKKKVIPGSHGIGTPLNDISISVQNSAASSTSTPASKKSVGKFFQIFEDSQKTKGKGLKRSSFRSVGSQSELTDKSDVESQTNEGEEYMYAPEINDSGYWRDLAERRREALDESLHENESLHHENFDLKEEVESLKKSLAEAEQLADIVKELLNEQHQELEKKKEEEEENPATAAESVLDDSPDEEEEKKKENPEKETPSSE